MQSMNQSIAVRFLKPRTLKDKYNGLNITYIYILHFFHVINFSLSRCCSNFFFSSKLLCYLLFDLECTPLIKNFMEPSFLPTVYRP